MISRYSWVASDRVADMISRIDERRPRSDGDEHLAVPDHDLECLHVLGGRKRQHGAGAEVEPRTMARADHVEALTVALAQRTVVVAAAVLNRVQPSVDSV